MKYPVQSMLILLEFARGKRELDAAVVDAGIEVIKFAYHYLRENVFPKGDASELSPEEALVAALAHQVVLEKHRFDLVGADLQPTLHSPEKHEIEAAIGNDQPKEFTPAVWVTIGLWVLEQVLKRVLN